jgi:hypothetical protein
MPAEDLRALIDTAVSEGSRFPWWSAIGLFVLSAAGAYLGSYVKRKGEDRASQENFDKLREQLRKTTQDTEEIKTALSRKNWLTQRQWPIREQHYLNLLAHLMAAAPEVRRALAGRMLLLSASCGGTTRDTPERVR